MALIILYTWLLAWNVYGWTSYNVNYKLIFRFNHHYSHLSQVNIKTLSKTKLPFRFLKELQYLLLFCLYFYFGICFSKDKEAGLLMQSILSQQKSFLDLYGSAFWSICFSLTRDSLMDKAGSTCLDWLKTSLRLLLCLSSSQYFA